MQLHGQESSERMESAESGTWSKQRLVCGPAKPSCFSRPLLAPSFQPPSICTII
jgi:hypothetical protein